MASRAGSWLHHEAVLDLQDDFAADREAVLLDEEINGLGDASLEAVLDGDDGAISFSRLDGAGGTA